MVAWKTRLALDSWLFSQSGDEQMHITKVNLISPSL